MIFQAVYSTSYRSTILAFGVPIPIIQISYKWHSVMSSVRRWHPNLPTRASVVFAVATSSIEFMNSRISIACTPLCLRHSGGIEIHWQHVLDRRIRSLLDKLSSNAKREYWISASDFVGNSRCLLLKGFENLFECFCKYTYIYVYLSVCGFCLGYISCMWYN